MTSFISKAKILFLSTFTPKKCGIASFASDLVYAINAKTTGNVVTEVCALEKNSTELYEYPVISTTNAYQLDAFIEMADAINKDDDIKLICIEHEFGLYGGVLGEYLLGFLSILEKPFIIRFHTVLPNPSAKMLSVVQAIALLADKIIVMTKNSARIIKEDYKVRTDKIIIIPHGTHASNTVNTNQLKAKYRLTNKKVLTTFGLLSPNKGIEKGILAMKEISAAFPEAMYIVLGQTHPNLLEQEGEKYREYLQQLIEENGLVENVRLINEYVPTKKLVEYLSLTDIYLFTSKDPEQAVSGTFLYAMSAGCPIISNSFVLAKEMLDKNTGVMLTTSKASELADHAIRILQNPGLKKEMSNNALLKTENTTWQKVGQSHVNLFNEILGTPVFTPELPAVYIN